MGRDNISRCFGRDASVVTMSHSARHYAESDKPSTVFDKSTLPGQFLNRMLFSCMHIVDVV